MIERYENCTDEELIERLRDGEEQIMEYLLNKYKNLVRSKAKSMYILGADSEDLIQEGMIGLFKAVRDYDAGRDASFSTFAQLCVSRNIYSAVQKSGRKKHAPLNFYTSIYGQDGERDRENTTESGFYGGMELMAGGEASNPEEIIIGQENMEQLQKYIETELSPFETQVLELHITGMGYVEIAKVLGRDEKATDNALQRIRAKLKRYRQQ
ncbi:MAG: sigma-70 family RNA polymerase sigma factor [Lachnospiraceae bacterium]|nr:sigma-70 family RNA polymerase sigma factor [Lachnospiraceae bacterium]